MKTKIKNRIFSRKVSQKLTNRFRFISDRDNSTLKNSFIKHHFTLERGFENDYLSNQLDHLPLEFKLNSPYPNPFNPSTYISYEIPILSDVSFIIYDVNGRVTYKSQKLIKEPGSYSFNWNARSHSSGIYFVSMVIDGMPSEVRKITLIK